MESPGCMERDTLAEELVERYDIDKQKVRRIVIEAVNEDVLEEDPRFEDCNKLSDS